MTAMTQRGAGTQNCGSQVTVTPLCSEGACRVVGGPPGHKGGGAMTPRIPLIIGIAVTALAFGVPTALGESALSIENTRSRVETPKAVPSDPTRTQGLAGTALHYCCCPGVRRRGQARRRAGEPDRGLGHALRYRSGVGTARSRSRPRTPPGRRVVPGGADDQGSSALALRGGSVSDPPLNRSSRVRSRRIYGETIAKEMWGHHRGA